MEVPTMNTEHEQLKIPLECYDTGELVIHTMDQAADRLCETNYGFLAPVNKITWHVDGRQGWNDVYEIAGERPTNFGLYTYMYHGQPFTIDDAEAMINSRKELNHSLFIAWAARFNLAFREEYRGDPLPRVMWPFRYVKAYDNGNGPAMRAAYQMRDDRSSFVIAGVDRDKVDESVRVNWSFFWREFLRKWQN
jgi:hypothetical protein